MIRITNFTMPVAEQLPLAAAAARYLRVPAGEVSEAVLVRQTLDARRYHGAPLQFVSVVDVRLAGGDGKVLQRLRRDKHVAAAPKPEASVLQGLRPEDFAAPKQRPVVVGFGPAGMFAALCLAKAGMAPLVLERGQDVDARQAAIERFWQGGELDANTNVQFGEGGAGTFSDGKLTTRISDPRMADVLEAFIAAGAPPEIRYLHKPHIGTDLLRGIVKNIRQEIQRLGGEVRFGAPVTELELSAGGVQAVIVAGSDRIPADTVLLGIGHSARDTYAMLYAHGVRMEPKAFAAGVRIEHPQEMIDRAQYGSDAGNPRLPAADYALTFKDRVTGRGAYSFCMCPGGQVVAAASEPERLVTNGMSLYARASGVANAALLVNVVPADFGGDVLGGMAFQREYEALAFRTAGSSWQAPVQTVGDFLHGTQGSREFLVQPTYRPGVRAADLHSCLPGFITRTLADALPYFDSRLHGFADPGAPMTGVEMRSSAPCRICRERESFVSVSTPGLYPMGEGAGYAGGIMSAAVDGLNTALAFLAKIRHTSKQ